MSSGDFRGEKSGCHVAEVAEALRVQVDGRTPISSDDESDERVITMTSLVQVDVADATPGNEEGVAVFRVGTAAGESFRVSLERIL